MPDNQQQFTLNLQDAFSGIGDWISQKRQKEMEAAQASQIKFSTDHTSGMSTFTGPTDYIQKQMGKANNFDRIQELYIGEMQKAEARREYMRAHPWQTALAELAASFAANDRNPVTRAIGQAAHALNPTDRELSAQSAFAAQGLERAEGMKLRHEEIGEAREERLAARSERQRDFVAREKRLDDEAKAKLKEDQARHAELKREFDARLAELKVHKGEVDEIKWQRLAIQSRSLINSIEGRIATLKENIEREKFNYQRLVESLGPPSTYNQEQRDIYEQKFMDSQTEIMREIGTLKADRSRVENEMANIGKEKEKPQKSDGKKPQGSATTKLRYNPQTDSFE